MPEFQQTFDGTTAALIYLVPTLVWAILAEDAWSFRLVYRPKNPLYAILPSCTLLATLFYGLHIPIALMSELHLDGRPPRWFDATDVVMALALASFLHLTLTAERAGAAS